MRLIVGGRWHRSGRQTKRIAAGVSEKEISYQGPGVEGEPRKFLSRDSQEDERSYLEELTFLLGPWPVFTRLRLFMTSVFKLIGRGRPCSLRNKPQALQSTEPTSSLRHSGVVEVPQFWQTGCN